ncbi:MAG: polyprenyl synthetase family protein [bacterium]|nr:polyprenyl synthetase family protein [bacterium]
MIQLLSHYQPQLAAYLQSYLTLQLKTEPATVWDRDVYTRLLDFTLGGKLLRGSLFLATYEQLGGKQLSEAMPVAAAIELLQTSLLIHDDIMDNDRFRRGKISIFAQYQELFVERKLRNPHHNGVSLAICVGDVAIFHGFGLLAKQPNYSLLTTFTQEFSRVGFGQMVDVELTATPTAVPEERILEMYISKTARYTFSLPFMAACQMTQVDTKTSDKLDLLGEKIGLLYQIRDDELGLFGSVAELGKPIMSDVREGKKTLYYLAAFRLASKAQRVDLERWYGNADLGEVEFEQVKDLLKSTGAQEYVDQKVLQLKKEAVALTEELSVTKEHQELLLQLIQYNMTRKK